MKWLPNIGFTLIELLIVTAITAIIALAIFSVFAGGVNIYRRASEYKTTQQEIMIALEGMERDLRNALDFSGIDFVGDEKKVSFPAIVTISDEKAGRYRAPGRASYYVDTMERALIKEEEAYPQATAQDKGYGKGAVRKAAPMEELKLSYFYYDKEAKKYDWKSSWNIDKGKEAADGVKKEGDGKFPLGVKIEAVYKYSGKEDKLVRTIFLPLAR